MSHRFFLNSSSDSGRLSTGDKITLQGDQAHHAINVMRFGIGDQLSLFDGSGIEYLAAVDAVKKKTVSLTILDLIEAPKSLTTEITIAVALPKGDRQKFLIEKMVELGVQTLIPLKTKRAVAVANPKVIARLEKQVIEASKQCGRNTLMEIAEVQTVNQLIQKADRSFPNAQRLVADPYQGETISNLISKSASGGKREFVVVIGPEGGLEELEVQLLIQSQFAAVHLGPSILRIETACLAVASILGIGTEHRD